MRIGLFFLLSLVLFISNCAQDAIDQEMVDKEIIEQYLADNSLTATLHEDGIYYNITQEGTGTEMPTSDSNVEVKYRGYLVDGTTFDQTTGDETRTFALSGVIPGWQTAIKLLKKGGKGTFYIPSALGYGANPPSFAIPRNAVLIFDVELIDFN